MISYRYISFYDKYEGSDFIAFYSSREPSAIQNVLLGFSARSAAGISLLPITVVKTRYEVSGNLECKLLTKQ